MIVFDKSTKPIKAWVKDKCDIEPGAMTQALNLSQLPFLHKHVALMPDVHQGYGMPIGGVIATDGVVIPNAVGVDIGCGMCAVRTSIKVEDLTKDKLSKIKEEIKKEIPVGFNHRKENCDEGELPNIDELFNEFPDNEEGYYGVIWSERASMKKQLGTLGSGNHFIEIQKGNDGFVWVMIHSGSRNLGKKVADHYNKVAAALNEKYYSSVPKEDQLAFLPLDTQEAKLYLAEMNYCVEFAKANRAKMMFSDIQLIFNKNDIYFTKDRYDVAHNYARMENHFGKNVMVHRKGATSAKAGEIGIIPGSMGTSSYIVEGLGNPDSFMSCSHGAGRVMGRNEAKKSLNLANEIDILNKQGILHDIVDASGLDEASGAYKNIADVMDNQKDLVKVIVELKPMAVIKG